MRNVAMPIPTLLGLALLAVGCNVGGVDDRTPDDDGRVDDTDTVDTDDTDDTDGTGDTTARLRFVHAAPGAPAVSVWADDELIADDLDYAEATAFERLDAGTYTLELCLADATSCVDPLATVEVMLQGGDVVTAVAAGLAGSENPNNALRILALEHGFQASDGDDDALVRIVHAGADAPAIDVDLAVDDDDDPEVVDLGRFLATPARGIELDEAARLGILTGNQVFTRFTLPNLVGDQWFLIATGLMGEKSYTDLGFELLAVGPQSQVIRIGQDPRVYMLHASPDTLPIDGFLGNQLILPDVAFGNLVQVQLSPGTYDIDLYRAQDGDDERPNAPAAYTIDDLELEARQEVLALATGLHRSDLASRDFRVVRYDAMFAQDAAGALVQAIHAMPGLPAIDMSTHTGGMLDEPLLYTDVGFTELSTQIRDLPAGSYDLAAALTGNAVAFATYDDVVLSGDEQAWAIPAGALGPNVAPLRLFLVDTAPTPWTIESTLAVEPD